ncbi:hypothetical protein [Aquabacterium humicola]|uniref:hypothetical protein n=1 Tax=Aquabacterium humicola TaxID=3237377 RepID=UPI002543D0D4|nr:hypothetical protein [Rubrivivax pictus]
MSNVPVWRRLSAIITFIGAFACAKPASAELLKVTYSGTLHSVSGEMLEDFFGVANSPTVGGYFKGGFVFDRDTPDSVAASNSALYMGGNSQFFVDFSPGAFVQNSGLPYNQSEVANDYSESGGPAYDLWTAYGQLYNAQGYEHVETGIVLLSLLLDAIHSDAVPLGVDLTKFELPECDLNGAGQAANIFCSNHMEFHAQKIYNPLNIYGDVDIYGHIDSLAVEQVPTGEIQEPGSLPLALIGGLALIVPRAASRRPAACGAHAAA